MKIQKQISDWLNAYLIQNELSSFVIGISGGVDSAVTSTLCAMTGKKTILLIMPIHQNPNETHRGEKHCDWLKKIYPNTEIIKMDLTTLYSEYLKVVPEKFHNKLALANTRARIRMSVLYLIAGKSDGIVVGKIISECLARLFHQISLTTIVSGFDVAFVSFDKSI